MDRTLSGLSRYNSFWGLHTKDNRKGLGVKKVLYLPTNEDKQYFAVFLKKNNSVSPRRKYKNKQTFVRRLGKMRNYQLRTPLFSEIKK